MKSDLNPKRQILLTPRHRRMASLLSLALCLHLPLLSQPETQASPPPSPLLQQLATIRESTDPRDVQQISQQYQDLLQTYSNDLQAKSDIMEEMASHYHSIGLPAYAIATLHLLADTARDDPRIPKWYYNIGLIHREMGAWRTAITRFYQVLNVSVTSLQSRNVHREFSQKAQFEIAWTYFEVGEYEKAQELFHRLQLLDLGPDDQMTVSYFELKSLFLKHDLSTFILRADNFLQRYPANFHSAEVRFLLAQSLNAVGRTDESLHNVLHLLENFTIDHAEHKAEWEFWRRKAGNFFANRFFESGEIHSALRIYQIMAKMSDKPDWLWPVIYQIGLCSERLNLSQRARDAYSWIIQEDELFMEIRQPHLTDIVESAKWRIERLQKLDNLSERIHLLLGPGSQHSPAL